MSFALAFNLIGYRVKYAVWIDWQYIRGGFESKAEAREWARQRFSRYSVKME